MAKYEEECSPLVRDFMRAARAIDRRLDECKPKHVSPNYEKNQCDYCFQHLIYSAPKTNKSSEDGIAIQKYQDRLNGIEKIMGSYYLENPVQ